jgi:hypothetical protein
MHLISASEKAGVQSGISDGKPIHMLPSGGRGLA